MNSTAIERNGRFYPVLIVGHRRYELDLSFASFNAAKDYAYNRLCELIAMVDAHLSKCGYAGAVLVQS
jgi:hypothetical protein